MDPQRLREKRVISWHDRASAVGQQPVESFRHCWSKEGKRRRGSARKMGKTPVPLRDKYTKIGEEGIALGENYYEKRESALKKGERLSLLSEGQAWAGSPDRRCILGTPREL